MSNTTRIAKNTLMLYFRQFLILLAGLYALRVKLDILGVEDYGIYNIAGGIVTMLLFLNEAMANSTQRFLNFAMGQNDTEQVQQVFTASFMIHASIAGLVIIAAETAGIWFFYTWLNIPPDRMSAAFIVYQFSVVSIIITILRVPYYATIIAYEKMSFFALVSIIEVFLKLGIIFLLPVIPFDKLILYAFLVILAEVIIFLLYIVYCKKHFKVAHLCKFNDKKLFLQMAQFSGWNLFGQVAETSSNHGRNILVNIFFGVTLNAAMGIASQVHIAVYTFVFNFQTAFKPQIIKSYAAHDYNYVTRLTFQASKVSFFLLSFILLPLYTNADFILYIWLQEVPAHAVAFTRLMLLNVSTTALFSPLIIMIQAIGNIKKYQIVTSFLVFFNFPSSLLFMQLGFAPEWIIIIKVGINVLVILWTLYFLTKEISLSITCYVREVILPIAAIVAISTPITLFVRSFFTDWPQLFISCFTSFITTGSIVYFIGLNSKERKSTHLWIKRKLQRA